MAVRINKKKLLEALAILPEEKNGHVVYPQLFPKKRIFPWDVFGGHYFMPDVGTDLGYCNPYVVTRHGLFHLGGEDALVTSAIFFEDEMEDGAIEAYGGGGAPAGGEPIFLCGRGTMDADGNWTRYACVINPYKTTADFAINKRVACTTTTLAEEAVDVVLYRVQKIKLELIGNTINAYRNDMATPKLSVTDTDIVGVGRWWVGTWSVAPAYIWYAKLLPPSSKVPKTENPIWVLLPIIGKGTLVDPYRVKLPERIVDHPRLEDYGRMNEVGVSHASIIPSDPKTGKPLHPVALSLISSKIPAKIAGVEKMIEEELRINPVFAKYARKLIPDYGEKIRLTIAEARKVGKLLNPKLPDDFPEKCFAVEGE